MNSDNIEILSSSLSYTLDEVCERCDLTQTTILEWVEFGIANPEGSARQDWQFSPNQLSRIHRARRLQRDLEINLPGLALALDLLEEVEAKRREVESLRQQLGL